MTRHHIHGAFYGILLALLIGFGGDALTAELAAYHTGEIQ